MDSREVDTPVGHAVEVGRSMTPVALVGAAATDSRRPAALGPRSLMKRLRSDITSRPVVDPGLAGGLRDWLEDSVAEVVAPIIGSATEVRVTKEVLHRVLTCENHFLAASRSPRPVNRELARGVLVDALFRQWISVGDIEDPWSDAVCAVSAAGDQAVVDFLDALGAGPRRELTGEIEDHCESIVSSWPLISPSWLGRTQERIEVPVAGGSVVLAGVIDLVLGAPSSGRASVCLVELKSGPRRLEHRADLHFYALLETLRSGAPPFRIATYYSATGELDSEQVGEDVLIGALHRVIDATARLCRLDSGAEPARTANPLCPWCSELPDCKPGRERAGSNVPRVGRALHDFEWQNACGSDDGEFG